MQYDQYLAMGLPIGTGVVESACGSVVKPRMEGGGAGVSQEQRPCSRCARSRRAMTMIFVPLAVPYPLGVTSPLRSPAKIQAHGQLGVSHNSTQNGYAREVMDCSCLDCRCYRRAVQNNPLSERQIPLAG